jgi:hypothetical protein
MYPGLGEGGLQLIFNSFILSGSLFTLRPDPTILAKVTIYPPRFTALFWLILKVDSNEK